MKHSKLITWLTAAFLSACAAAALSAGITAEASTGSGSTTSGLNYTYDTATGKATITGYSGSSAVTIPSTIGSYTVTAIGDNAFRGLNIYSVEIAPTVTTIGNRAFYDCENLTTVSTINATTVGEYAFYQCFFLDSVSLPNATTLGNAAFYRCISLETVSVPKVVSIGSSVFAQCHKLTGISLQKVQVISNSAFWECKKLASVSVPKAVTIEDAAFERCYALTSISLPSTVTSVGRSAFEDCTALTTASIPGAAVLGREAFQNCTALTSIQLGANSRTPANVQAFVNCPNLYTVNNVTALQYQTDSSGRQYPVFRESVLTAVRNHFCRSTNVGFIDKYCLDLCYYIVATETDPWMCDALRARQLHDWLVRHCEYEDELNGESQSDSENHTASSVFVSYALNIRGNGVGESVCEGFAQAYTMLLSAADVESYVVAAGGGFFSGHGWNLIRIGNKYYEADATWDDTDDYTQYGTEYTYFLKSDTEMRTLHNTNLSQYQQLGATCALNCASRHSLLNKYHGDVAALIAGCTESLTDINHDGLYDDDFDLGGGYMDSSDWQAYHNYLQFLFGIGTREEISLRLPEVLYELHQRHMNFWEYLNNSAPTSQTVHAGQPATFAVTLFGDQLTYQWKYWNTDINMWVNVTLPGATSNTLSFSTTQQMDGMYFMCIVWNKNGYSIYSNPVQLTVN